ncbi:TetR/AcrR family transcriptional regulator [Helicobacter burdigaliensis]|uniref:TetR/AcrR family transcriptional regulator n=1 Tax=Helicobacter burdigaliensis TaxID=2315334 RepID=UPI00130057C0|nr:TetR/AcrR family transcriptional regulator [Helicobacter burdigaliensis]
MHRQTFFKKQQAKKERILDIAYKIFLEHGYEKTSLQMIVKETGGSLATIYDIFQNKNNLFKESIAKAVTHFIEEFQTHLKNQTNLQNNSLSLEDYLKELGMKLCSNIVSKNSIALHRLVVIEGYKNPDLLHTFNTVCVENSKQYFIEGLRFYQENNELKFTNLKEAVQRFLNLLITPYLWASITDSNFKLPSQKDIEENVKLCVQIFLLWNKTQN